MFRVTEFRNRKPRTFGAAYFGIAALLYVLAFAITNSSSYKTHQNKIWFLPLGLTFLSVAWGVMAILYVLLGSKLNQLSAWMRFDVEPSRKSAGKIETSLRVAVMFIFLIAYLFTIFPLTFVLFRALLHLPLFPR